MFSVETTQVLVLLANWEKLAWPGSGAKVIATLLNLQNEFSKSSNPLSLFIFEGTELYCFPCISSNVAIAFSFRIFLYIFYNVMYYLFEMFVKWVILLWSCFNNPCAYTVLVAVQIILQWMKKKHWRLQEISLLL